VGALWVGSASMSKLADRIRLALRTEQPPMGFAAASARAARPSLLVGVVVSSLSAERAGEAASRGADTCLFAASDPKEGELQEALTALGDTPAGLLPRQTDRSSLDRLAEAGLDYLAFTLETPAAALLHPQLGRVLVLEGELSDALLRTLDPMPVDAIYLRSWKGPLTVRGHMELQRIAGFSRKPLMIPVPAQVDGPELEALREAGVVILAVDGDRRENLEALPALRQAVSSLPARRRRREERPEAILPPPQPVAVAATEEEPEEEDEP